MAPTSVQNARNNQSNNLFIPLLVSFNLIAVFMSGCFIETGGDDYEEDRYYEDRYYEDRYEDEVYVDEVYVDESEVLEESEREVIEETEEETTTTTTTVETPPVPAIEQITCSADDQGFDGSDLVEAFVVTPPEQCMWRSIEDEISPDLGLGFIDVTNDDEYSDLFDCGGGPLTSDVDWDTEVVVHLSGWIPAGSQPRFEWAVNSESGEVVLGLVSSEVCSDGLEFYQNAFITPRREVEPRVISCVMPTDCE